jgi:hypothetical protein
MRGFWVGVAALSSPERRGFNLMPQFRALQLIKFCALYAAE